MPQELVLHTAPVGPLLSDKQLLNGRVQYQPFSQYQTPATPQHKNVLHTGVITAVHAHPRHGLMVRIQPDENALGLVAGWYVLKHQVTGWAWFAPAEIAETQKAIA